MRAHPVAIAVVSSVSFVGGVLGMAGSTAVAATGDSTVATTSDAPGAAPEGTPCAALVGMQLGDAVVDRVDPFAAGAKTSIVGQTAATDICRVSAHISPVAGSRINVRVWLPANWNGKMLGLGGGGFNGSLSIDGIVLTGPVNKGYAAVVTDAGHDVSDGAKWALNNPQKIVDFGYRANHLAAIATKAIVAKFYGVPAKRAYFQGCSNGGRDALMLAQRYPSDYNAIVAGAPANSWTALMSAFARNGQLTRLSPTADILAPKLKLVHDAALRKCDAADGAKDGLISNPSTCRFDPAILQCKAGGKSDCLSKTEVAAVRAIYRGTRTADGRTIMPGFSPGSEMEWPAWFTAPKASAPGMADDFYRYMVYSDPNWDRTGFVLDRDYPVAKRRVAPALDATDPNLQPFVRLGGKLLMYHGWDDPAIPAASSVRYYDEARRALGERSDAVRLFMVPGMAHCGGGAGPNALDWLGALDAWVETGSAPERLTATKYKDEKFAFLGMATTALATRPVCAWPKTPRYKGIGSTSDQASFVCR